MKTVKIVAVLLAAIMMFGLVACSTVDTSYIATTGTGKQIPSEIYKFYIQYLRDTYAAQYASAGTDFASVLSQADSTGQTLSDYLVSTAQNEVAQYEMIREKFDELQLTLPADVQQYIDTNTESAWATVAGNTTLGELVQQVGLTKDQYKDMNATSYKASTIIDYYFGEGGIYEITEDEIVSNFDTNYARFKYISLAKVDPATSTTLNSDEIAAKAATANEAFGKAQTEAFEDLIAQYSEDYTPITNDMDADAMATATASNAVLTEDGVILNKDGVFNETYYQYYGVKMDDTITTKLFSMNVGDVEKVETSNAIWIIKKYDLHETDEYLEAKRAAIFTDIYTPQLDSMMTQWYATLNLTFNPDTLALYAPENLTTVFNMAATAE